MVTVGWEPCRSPASGCSALSFGNDRAGDKPASGSHCRGDTAAGKVSAVWGCVCRGAFSRGRKINATFVPLMP